MGSDSADVELPEPDLVTAVGAARSLEEIEAWMKMRPGVKSVRLAEYVKKSHPPQREFILEASLRGEIRKLIVNVFDEGGGRFRFNSVTTVDRNSAL